MKISIYCNSKSSLDCLPRCQKEFEKDYMEGLNKEKFLSQMADPNIVDTEKKKLKVRNVCYLGRSAGRSTNAH